MVIGMTLAEVFLLLLIVGWYGSRLESEEKGSGADVLATVPKADFDTSELRRQQAEDSLAQMTSKYNQLDQILDWIAKTAGLAKPIRNLEDAKDALNKNSADARRGRPRCRTDNVLVDVQADSGPGLVTIRQELRSGGRVYSRGGQLRLTGEIAEFLDEVDAFYQTRRNEQRDCVFDFTLTWRTDSDYRRARELFEQHFYPARIRQLK